MKNLFRMTGVIRRFASHLHRTSRVMLALMASLLWLCDAHAAGTIKVNFDLTQASGELQAQNYDTLLATLRGTGNMYAVDGSTGRRNVALQTNADKATIIELQIRLADDAAGKQRYLTLYLNSVNFYVEGARAQRLTNAMPSAIGQAASGPIIAGQTAVTETGTVYFFRDSVFPLDQLYDQLYPARPASAGRPARPPVANLFTVMPYESRYAALENRAGLTTATPDVISASSSSSGQQHRVTSGDPRASLMFSFANLAQDLDTLFDASLNRNNVLISSADAARAWIRSAEVFAEATRILPIQQSLRAVFADPSTPMQLPPTLVRMENYWGSMSTLVYNAAQLPWQQGEAEPSLHSTNPDTFPIPVPSAYNQNSINYAALTTVSSVLQYCAIILSSARKH